MRSKTFIILAVVCCVLLTAVLFTAYKRKPSRQQAIMGQKLFADLAAQRIAIITVTSPEGSVMLKQGEGVWTVANRFDYPADFSKISDLVQKIITAKIGRSFEASDNNMSRLALHPPDKNDLPNDSKGVRVVLADANSAALADVMIGKQREDSDGRGTGTYYVMRAKDPQVYVIDKSFRFIDKKPSDWLDKKLLDLDAKQIEKVICSDAKKGGTIYTLRRPAEGKEPEFVNLPRGRKPATYKIEQVFDALSSLTIQDIADPAADVGAAAFSGMPHFEFHLFDGTVYHAYPGAALKDGTENHYFKAAAGYAPRSDKDDPDQKDKPAGLAAKIEALNKKLSAWTYVIPLWAFNSLVQNPKDLFEEEKKP